MNEKARLKIFRYDESMSSPVYRTYEVPNEKGLTVLQALFWITEIDDDPPAFRRYHCNRGQCCSCLMTIDGEIKRACTTEVRDEMLIEPVQDFPLVRDLIVDFGRWVDGKFIRKGILIEWPKPAWRIDRDIKQWLVFHEEKCTGCGMCQEVCPVNEHKNVTDRYGQNRVSPILFQDKNDLVDPTNVCLQCTNAPCMHFCPTKVISRDEKTGAVRVEKEFCIGCGMCLTACPNDAIFLDRERGKAIKCEMCGGSPRCAEHCPTGALQVSSAG